MTREEAINIISQMIKDEEGFLSDNTVEAHKMAIKALEQESCEDAISRSDMLDAIGHGTTYTSEELQRIIKGLPPVYPQPKWIPVSEELPEGLMIKTLVSCENDDGLPVCTMIAVYDGFKQKWDCDYRVKAWMPLPTPYEPQERSDKT